MGTQISASYSKHLPPGFYIPPHVIALLIANGWERKDDPPVTH